MLPDGSPGLRSMAVLRAAGDDQNVTGRLSRRWATTSATARTSRCSTPPTAWRAASAAWSTFRQPAAARPSRINLTSISRSQRPVPNWWPRAGTTRTCAAGTPPQCPSPHSWPTSATYEATAHTPRSAWRGQRAIPEPVLLVRACPEYVQQVLRLSAWNGW